MYQYLRDKKSFKKYEVLEKKTDLTNPNYLPISLNCSEISSVVSENLIPHIVFEYTITTHEFYSSSYFKLLTKNKQNYIMKL